MHARTTSPPGDDMQWTAISMPVDASSTVMRPLFLMSDWNFGDATSCCSITSSRAPPAPTAGQTHVERRSRRVIVHDVRDGGRGCRCAHGCIEQSVLP